MPSFFLRIATVTGFIGFILMVIACSTSPTGLTPKETDKTLTDKDKTLTDKDKDKNTKPIMSAEEWTKEFVMDEAGAKKKYQSKEVSIEGVVLDKEMIQPAGITLVLAGFKGEKETINVRCGIALINRNTANQITKVKAGDKVRLKGEYTIPFVSRDEGKPSTVTLDACDFLP